MRKYDVVVVGAGVAGLYAGLRVAERGFRVAVVESKPRERIGDKPCGDAIGVHHLKEVDLELPARAVDHKYEGIVVFDPSEKHSIVVPGAGVSVNRVEMGQWLLKRALDSGVDLYDRHWLVRVFLKDERVTSIEAREAGSLKPVLLEATAFIDASGAKPALRSKLPIDWPISERPYTSDYNVAYREVIELERPIDLDSKYSYIYLNKEVAPGGYWWIFPKNSSGTLVNAGLGVLWGVEEFNPRIFYERHLRNRLRGRVINRGGGLVPTRRPLPTLVWRNVVVVGDAAYTVNPVHGGGIGSSLRASHIVSKRLIEALEAGNVSEETLWTVNEEYMEAYGAKQAALDVVRMYLQKLDNSDFEWIMRSRVVDSDSLYDLGYSGRLGSSVVSRIHRALRLLQRPSMLNQLRIVKKYMDEVERLYRESYPAEPSGIFKWMELVERTFEEYRSQIGYDPGVKVRW